MAEVTDTVLKAYFETEDVPTQAQFIDLIDSKVNKPDLASTDAGKGASLSTFRPVHANEVTVTVQDLLAANTNVLRWIDSSQHEYILTGNIDSQDADLVTAGLQNAFDDLISDYPNATKGDSAQYIEMTGVFSTNDSIKLDRPSNHWVLTGRYEIWGTNTDAPLLTWKDDPLQTGGQWRIENGFFTYTDYVDADKTNAIHIALPAGSGVNVQGNQWSIVNTRHGYGFRGISTYDPYGAGTAALSDTCLIDKFYDTGRLSGSFIRLSNLNAQTGGNPVNRISNGWLVGDQNDQPDRAEAAIKLGLGGPWVIDNVQWTRQHVRAAGESRGVGFSPTLEATYALDAANADVVMIAPALENCTVEVDNLGLIGFIGSNAVVIGGRTTTFSMDSDDSDPTDVAGVFRLFETNLSILGFQMKNSGTLTHSGNYSLDGTEYLIIDTTPDPTSYALNIETLDIDSDITPSSSWEVWANLEHNLTSGVKGGRAIGRTAGAGTEEVLWSMEIPVDSMFALKAESVATDSGSNHAGRSSISQAGLAGSTAAGVRFLHGQDEVYSIRREVTGNLTVTDIVNTSGDTYRVDFSTSHGLHLTTLEADEIVISGTTNFNNTYSITGVVDADSVTITQTGSPADETSISANAAYTGQRQTLQWVLSGNDIQLVGGNTYPGNVDWAAKVTWEKIEAN